MRFTTTRRNGYRSAALTLFVLLLAFTAEASAVTIQWSPVGNLGNASDTATGSLYGAVPYAYNIGTYDVTNSQYVEFLNTKDPTGADTLHLWNVLMANATDGGINFNFGNANGNKYTLISGAQNHPVNSVTWYDAIRFANWLNNGQGNGDTETGAYTLLGPLDSYASPINGDSIMRNPGARVFLPSQNEWYKAAYYNPATSSYYKYATSSNTAPTATGPTATPNSANYNNSGGHPTDVGAYSGTTSPFGAFDMGGNVYQWDEDAIPGSAPTRAQRGGAFYEPSFFLQSGSWHSADPLQNFQGGFRVADVPEPSTGVLAVIACGTLSWWRKRFK